MNNEDKSGDFASKGPEELIISLEDLSSPSIELSVERLQESAKPQLVRTGRYQPPPLGLAQSTRGEHLGRTWRCVSEFGSR